MEQNNNQKNPKIYHRYIRRDSNNQSAQIKVSSLSRNQTNIISRKKTANNHIYKIQSFSSILNTEFTKRKSEQINSSQLSKRIISKPSINSTTNISKFNDRRNKKQINQPRTPLIHSSTFQERNAMTEFKTKRKIQTPQINETNSNFIKVNNLTYYVRCPYCKHVLNQEPKKEQKIIISSYKKSLTDNKENIDFNFNKKNLKEEFEYGVKKIIKKEKTDHKNFYVNEKGVIVFQQNNKPTTSIKIINTKPDLSKYINDAKVFGKKNNIGIYEAPVPETQVFVRPIIV